MLQPTSSIWSLRRIRTHSPHHPFSPPEPPPRALAPLVLECELTPDLFAMAGKIGETVIERTA
jgi:hypothetical protein